MTQEAILMYAILAIYNLAVIKLLSVVLNNTDIRSAVKEKTEEARPAALQGYTNAPPTVPDETSYSRVIGLIGGVAMAAFFWAVGNVVLFKAFVAPADVGNFVTSLSGYFLSGAALFLPYAVNQLRAAFTK
ncbi:hypothetical protein FA04_32935 (plasmid) [Ensifer adhaerens]|uniref:Uncharacterized protein n=1 Tax=Ensifer adhaerens TaxID=106592 RepID=A0ABY8HSC9_ENSAD|nr:hypothetical protein [Ensifer adhaerens]ANK77437.1 hypothetical protein FA04_32935 [Ensifer adhaerens]KDP73015.1 hypothetical protein FA04_14545 [Ensifer adhaerens]WFP94703.1 hypothetical protein P4B07_33430 [Ensifer adhaerens]